jgi:hypothetical protein
VGLEEALRVIFDVGGFDKVCLAELTEHVCRLLEWDIMVNTLSSLEEIRSPGRCKSTATNVDATWHELTA